MRKATLVTLIQMDYLALGISDPNKVCLDLEASVLWEEDPYHLKLQQVIEARHQVRVLVEFLDLVHLVGFLVSVARLHGLLQWVQ
jgi:hypothetical protein